MAWFAVIGTASVAISPMFFLGNISGHDFEFHLASWMEVSRQWTQGVLFPRWAALANFGYGEPRFIFYPPGSWMFGAALGQLLPWTLVPGVFIWLALVTAGLSMLRLARQWLPPAHATAAAMLYVLSPYIVVEIYYRSDFAELLVCSMLPLLVLHALRLKERGWDGVTPLALVFAAIWLANPPAAVIATYALGLVLLTVAISSERFSVLLHGTVAVAGGFSLCAFYIVPAVWEQPWVNIRRVLDPGLTIGENFLFAHSENPEFVLFNWKISGIVLVVAGLTMVAVLLSRGLRRRNREQWWALAVLAGVCTFLMTRASSLVWKWLPELRFVQFPWRLLMVMAVPCILLWLSASLRWRRTWPALLIVGTIFVSVASLVIADGFWDEDSDSVHLLHAAIVSGRGYEGTDEYEPIGCDRYDLPDHAALIAAVGATAPKAPIQVHQWRPEHKEFSSTTPAVVALKLVNYPAWKAAVNGRPTAIESAPGTAQMLIRLNDPSSTAKIEFTRTADRTGGGVISVASLVVLLALRVFKFPNATAASGGTR